MNHHVPQADFSTSFAEVAPSISDRAMMFGILSNEKLPDSCFEEEKGENSIERMQLSHSGNLEEFMFRHTTRKGDSFSSLILDESVFVLMEALKRSFAVDISMTTDNLYEIRRLTCFSWERLADLLNVDDEIMILWVRGERIADEHFDHIARTLSVLRYSDKGDSELNAMDLDRTRDNASVFKLIKNQKYLEAIRSLGPGIGRPQSTKTKQYRFGDSAPIFTHAMADGTEDFIPPPDVPEPNSKRIKVRKI